MRERREGLALPRLVRLDRADRTRAHVRRQLVALGDREQVRRDLRLAQLAEDLHDAGRVVVQQHVRLFDHGRDRQRAQAPREHGAHRAIGFAERAEEALGRVARALGLERARRLIRGDANLRRVVAREPAQHRQHLERAELREVAHRRDLHLRLEVLIEHAQRGFATGRAADLGQRGQRHRRLARIAGDHHDEAITAVIAPIRPSAAIAATRSAGGADGTRKLATASSSAGNDNPPAAWSAATATASSRSVSRRCTYGISHTLRKPRPIAASTPRRSAAVSASRAASSNANAARSAASHSAPSARPARSPSKRQASRRAVRVGASIAASAMSWTASTAFAAPCSRRIRNARAVVSSLISRGAYLASRAIAYSRAVVIRRFSMPIVAAAEDIDELGHVSNVVYVRWVLDVAMGHSRACGWDFAEYRALGAVFVVRRHEIDYIAPVSLGQELVATTWVETWRGASVVRRTDITRGDHAVARGATTWAFMSIASGRPTRIPEELHALFREPAPHEPTRTG